MARVDAPHVVHDGQARPHDEARQEDVLMRLSAWLAAVSAERALSTVKRDASGSIEGSWRGGSVLPLMGKKQRLT
jgi:hypothetical protein